VVALFWCVLFFGLIDFAPAVQLLLAAAALVGGAALGARPEPLIVAAVVSVLAALLFVVAPRGRTSVSSSAELPRRLAVPLLVVAVAGAPFWAGYAWQAAAASRTGLGDDISVGIPHWAVQTAVGLAIAGSALAAASWPQGRHLLATSAGLAAVLLGVAPVAYPEATGAMPSRLAGLAAIAWGIAVAALARVPRAG
jgi:hypothetical protein